MADGAALGIVSQPQEQQLVDLHVEGKLPTWLSGSLLRTVPAQFEVGGRRIEHWFDGLAMLNAFAFEDGKVSYTSRFLRSDTYRQALENGTRPRRGFANDPCVSVFKRAFSLFSPSVATLTDNGNVNIGKLGDRMVALTEAPMRVAFDPGTLETLGLVKHPDNVGYGHGTPHPHYDDNASMVNSVTTFGVRPHYRLYSVGADARRHEIASMATREPAYMHSFAITERHLVLIEQPFVIDPLEVILSRRPLRSLVDYFIWKPERGTRLHVFSRATGERIKTVQTSAFFFFHTINAFDEGENVVIDFSCYANPDIVNAFFLETMQDATRGFPTARPTRLCIGLRDGRVQQTQLADLDFELPGIDSVRHDGRPYRFAYAVGRHEEREQSFWDQLVKLDTHNGEATIWREAGTNPSEPTFVRGPGADKNDGIVLSVVLDQGAKDSYLLVLDARSFTEIARARAPQRIPFGFHGQHSYNLPDGVTKAVN